LPVEIVPEQLSFFWLEKTSISPTLKRLE
jgi:hypothetical protein